MSSNLLDAFKESICYTCKYGLTRLVELNTPEDIEYYMDILEIDKEDISEYDVYIEQHKCLLTNEDLYGIVKECTNYTPLVQKQLIGEYKF